VVDFFDNGVIFDEELPVFFGGAAAGECPSLGDGVDVEGPQDGLFDFVWDCHVIFNGIEAAEDEVEHADLRKGRVCQ